ncbi:hypothetical protein EIKCOROL_01819 [Eikenella corrodens ATCC 23834]|uniref:Uncharacterized protein n=1 Tax=Eikenella corrodens ATCC 23834 TaxID=546274 RepID=C0DWR6_EIKCO|nr:hypothetical protein EIKCOROL_01819 [Eikenella corrodens ATCC 23834]
MQKLFPCFSGSLPYSAESAGEFIHSQSICLLPAAFSVVILISRLMK